MARMTKGSVVDATMIVVKPSGCSRRIPNQILEDTVNPAKSFNSGYQKRSILDMTLFR